MKKSVVTFLSLTLIAAGALAQTPSPAPAPEAKPEAQTRQRPEGMGERRWGGGGGMDNREFGMERLVGAMAQGQEITKKLNLTPEQQELIKRLVTEQRAKMGEMQEAMRKAALKQAEILMADPLDEKALMVAVEETSKARTEMAKNQIQVLIEVRKVLTEGQRKQLREIMLQMKQQPRPEGGMREGREGREGREPRREHEDKPAAPAPMPAPAPVPPPPAN